jgi:hypothetical protein
MIKITLQCPIQFPQLNWKKIKAFSLKQTSQFLFHALISPTF